MCEYLSTNTNGPFPPYSFHLEAECAPEGGGYELDVPIIRAVYHLVCYLSRLG